jgi:general secretion pathway protein K
MTEWLRNRERGFVLITVLLFAALLASLLAGVLQMSLSNASSAVAFSDASRADELGRTAVDLIAQQASSPNPDAKRGGTFAVHLKDAEIYVDYVSEAARIDVNSAAPDLIVSLFKAAGAEPAEAKAIGEKINAWRSNSATAQQQNTPSAEVSAGQKTIPPISIEHEAQIGEAWGVSSALLAKVRSSLTVANVSSKVDPILASPLIIEALFADKPLRAADFLDRRARGFANETEALSALPVEAQAYVGFSPATAYRGEVRVQMSDGFKRNYETVVVPPQRRGDGVHVIAWEALH